MKKKTLLLLLPALFSLLVSCDHGLTGHEIVGRWERAGEIYEFCDDGTLIHGDCVYPYSVNGKEVTVDRDGNAVTLTYSLNPNGTLRLGDFVYYPVGQRLKSSDESAEQTSSFAEKSIARE